ncbi:MAG: hypothetical protein ACREQV_02900 [Candidatus Binatia bacterium]
MKTQITSTLAFVVLCCWSVPADAEYTLILKNGRRIAVQSYREEKGLVKFNGLGGEIGISKEQIQAIRQGDAVAPGDLDFTRSAPPTHTTTDASAAAQEGAGRKALTAEEERAGEEREYQAKLKSLNDRLKAAQDSYAESIRGTADSDPMQLVTEEQVKARQDDLTARFKDAQNNPSEPAPVKLLIPSPFSSLPPTVAEVQPSGRSVSPFESPQTLTGREQQLLDLRNQTVELEKERERLINEMKQKNFLTGTAGQ